MSGDIDPKYGARVFVTFRWSVGIKQRRPGEGDSFVFFHPDEIESLIEELRTTSQEAREIVAKYRAEKAPKNPVEPTAPRVALTDSGRVKESTHQT